MKPSLSDRIRSAGRSLAVHVAEDIRNGNRSEARKRLREADRDVAFLAIGALYDFIDGPSHQDLFRFLASFADF